METELTIVATAVASAILGVLGKAGWDKRNGRDERLNLESRVAVLEALVIPMPARLQRIEDALGDIRDRLPSRTGIPQ